MARKKSNQFFGAMCLVLLFSYNVGLAQTSGGSTESCNIKSIAANVYDDFLYLASSPLRMSTKDALQLSVFALVTAGFISSLDEPIDNAFVEANEDGHYGVLLPFKGLAELGEVYDDISPAYFTAGLTTAMLAGGLIFKDKKLLLTTRLMVESLVITQEITALGKGFFGRSRPYTEKGSHDFNFFKFSSKKEFKSLPSGHTSSIFAMLTVIAKQYDQWWIKIPSYIGCASVAMQRIDSRNHWAADVIVEGTIGYWVGSTLVNHYKDKSQPISFNPYLSPNRVGIIVSFDIR